MESGGPQGANSDTIGIDTFSYTPAGAAAALQHVHDFDGDGKTDFTVVRQTNVRGGVPQAGQTTWFIANASGTGGQQSDFGVNSDFFLSGDYDGDKKSDIAVFRPGTFATFYIINSSNNTIRTEQFGTSNDDISVAADYDGDGKTTLRFTEPVLQSVLRVSGYTGRLRAGRISSFNGESITVPPPGD